MAQGLFFRKVLADQAIGIFIQAPLPGMIGPGKVALAIQGGGDRFMAGEFQAIIKGYGMDLFRMKLQQADDFLGYQLGLFLADISHQRPPADSLTQGYQIPLSIFYPSYTVSSPADTMFLGHPNGPQNRCWQGLGIIE